MFLYVWILNLWSSKIVCISYFSCIFYFLALTFNSLIGEESWNQRGHNETVTVSRSKLIEVATDLCHIMQYEFIFKPVSNTLDFHILNFSSHKYLFRFVKSHLSNEKSSWFRFWIYSWVYIVNNCDVICYLSQK